MPDRSLEDNLAEIEVTQRPSLNAVEAEKSVLSICMRNTDALKECVGKAIVPDDFSDVRHAIMYEAIRAIYLDGKPVSRFSVCEKIRTTGQSGRVSDEYVYGVANVNAVITALDSYIEVVSANTQTRKLLSALDDITKAAKERKGTINDIVDLGVGKLNAIKVVEENSGFEELSTILKRNIQDIEKNAFGESDSDIVKTGFSYLDSITGGFKPGTINIIGARPGMGKTALALNIATNVAGLYSKTVAIFSLEMSKSEIANRILASKSELNYKAIERATVTREELDRLGVALQKIASYPIYVDEKTNTNPVDIMVKCKELQSRTKLSLIIIDYLQLLSYPGRSGGSRQQEIADISRSLKVLAKELKVPVIALSQLNRDTEKREDSDHIPGLADIRDSGAIEQDADCVIFIHRPDYYNKGKKEKDKIEDAQLIVAKNRHGETDTAYVKWYGARTMFFEPDRKSDPKDPQGSGFTRTRPAQAASSDYSFDDPPEEIPDPEPIPDYSVNDEAPGDFDEGAYENLGNSENEAFFADDMHDGLPEGF